MDLAKSLQIFSFVLFTAFCYRAVVWMLNQPSDLLLVLALLLLLCYVFITIKTKAFTFNPFKK